MKYLSVLLQNRLFRDFSTEEAEQILACLQPRYQECEKGECLLLAGSKLSSVGIVLTGSLSIQRQDADGRVVLVDELSPADSFGEAFVCAGVKAWPVSLWALQKTRVIFLDYTRMLTLCPSACSYHTKLLGNLLAELAQKLIGLNQKLDIVQKSTIRDKLLALFGGYVVSAGANCFTLPFSREELADYLGVNRSALSRELSRMQTDGIVQVKGRQICLPQ